jgi:hypothetical protein
MAILLPADTPVTSGSALPLNVHWGPVLAAAATVMCRIGTSIDHPVRCSSAWWG